MNPRLLILFTYLSIMSWNSVFPISGDPIQHELLRKNKADSIVATLTLEEQIAQLMMVAVYPKQGKAHENKISAWVKESKVGGLIIFQGSPEQVASSVNRFQGETELPLLVATDAEWGPAMRFSNSPSFPKAMALGAVGNDSLIYFMGKEIGKELKRLGIHVNFAPVVDVNNNPSNPVIGIRSFGESPAAVSKKSWMYLSGMQDAGVMGVLKHFPGHGDTHTDSHHALPVIQHARARLDSIELAPFRALVDSGAEAVMMAHMHVPALDSTTGSISSISPTVIQEVLVNDIGFEGLVFTDALNMKGASSSYGSGTIEVKAIQAGVDVLLMPKDVPLAIQSIKEAIEKKQISKKSIQNSCRKIMEAKLKWIEWNKMEVESEAIIEDLNNPTAEYLNEELTRKSITLILNQNQILPLAKLNQTKLSIISIGEQKPIAFESTFQKIKDFKSIHLSRKASKTERIAAQEKLDKNETVVITFQANSWSPDSHFGFETIWRNWIAELNTTHPVILVMFGNPYTLINWPDLDRLNAVIMAYQNTPLVQKSAAESILGINPVNGTLPVGINPSYPAGFGLTLGQTVRIGYAVPEAVGIDRLALLPMDSIIEAGIREGAYPGCQVLVVKDQKIIYERNMGYYTYDSIQSVQPETLYDIASITKVAATVPVLMKLEDDGHFSLDGSLAEYLPNLVENTPYQFLDFKSILAHQAGLTSWIPFFLNTLDSNGVKPRVFSDLPTVQYSYQLADGMYINRDFKDSIYHWIVETPLRKNTRYLYSDIGYYFFLNLIENYTQSSLDSVAHSLFYVPLGMKHTCFNPRRYFSKSAIAPTEHDTLFRDQLIQGYVHDPGAAMLGGVAGHAGLFSTAYDLAVLFQMYLNKGTYGRERFLSAEVIDKYTACQFCEEDNRRGAGFDKPVRGDEPGPSCNCVSYDSYGHSGFTGTLVWADPEKQVVFVFLSNRIYPTAENRKLIKMNIRTTLQEAFYSALGSFALN